MYRKLGTHSISTKIDLKLVSDNKKTMVTWAQTDQNWEWFESDIPKSILHGKYLDPKMTKSHLNPTYL